MQEARGPWSARLFLRAAALCGAMNDPDKPATMVATRVVPAADEDAFARWADGMAHAAAAAPGCCGSIRLKQAGGLVHLIYRFADADALECWRHSSGFRTAMAEGERFPVELRQCANGPKVELTIPAESSASTIKSAALTWVTVFPVLLLVSTTVRSLAGGLPQPLQLLISSLIMVGILSWIILPRVQRWLRPWTLADADGKPRR